MAARLALRLALALALLARHHTAHAQAMAPTPPPKIAAIALSIRSRAIQDSRCYLMNGGAVESFFISEDTPVGSTIGTLSVNGDPGEAGDITLRLQEQGAGAAAGVVGVAPRSKNLTLLRPLDREELLGPSNVYVNVRCDRRRTTDPSFIIPVSVRVWDVNDNAPEWQHAPFSVRLSELAAVGSTVLVTRATDRDQPGSGATVHYSVLPGPHSEYVGFASELDGTIVVKKPLDYESLRNFTVRLRASDRGSPPLHSDTSLRLEVLDADDQNPRFSHDHYTALIPPDAAPGTILETLPGPISARDQDLAINAPLVYSLGGGEPRAPVALRPDTGELLLAADPPAPEAGLAAPITIVLKATQLDNPDRYALATLQLRSEQLEPRPAPVRFVRRLFQAAVREDTTPPALLLTLHTTPPAPKGQLQFYVSDRSFLEKFAINSAGEVLLRRPLDYETTQSYFYQVMVTDGVSNDTCTVNITVENVNEWEPRFRYPQYEFRAAGDPRPDGLLPLGRLDVHDGDAPDRVALTLHGPHASMLVVNEAGEVFARATSLGAANTSVLHALATARDSGTPPRQTSVPILVHLPPPEGQAGGPGGVGLVAAGGAALALLVLIVCALLFIIHRHKRQSKASEVQSKTNSGFVTHEKPRSLPPTLPTGGAGATGGPGAAAGNSGSLLSVSAGASTILANSTSSLDLRSAESNPTANVGRASQRFQHKSKVAPLAAGGGAGGPGGGDGDVSLMSDHLRAVSPRSGVAWPAATIPARVRRLDTAHQDSETPTEATNNALSEHMNLTVYF